MVKNKKPKKKAETYLKVKSIKSEDSFEIIWFDQGLTWPVEVKFRNFVIYLLELGENISRQHERVPLKFYMPSF